jgi:hypothetical protein
MTDCAKIYLGLVHYPIKNKKNELVTTSVTNLDIHDISRSVKTFGLQRYFIITPLEPQKALVNKILGHWGEGKSSDYNPDRSDALSSALVIDSIEKGIEKIKEETGEMPIIALTGANFLKSDGTTKELAKKIKIDKKPCFLLFGTGWGLHEDALEMGDFLLGPIIGANNDYNHLSVRSAVAIYLNELCKDLGI